MDDPTIEPEVAEVEELETAEVAPTTETAAAEPAEVIDVTLETADEQPVEFKELYDLFGGSFAEYAHGEGLTIDEAKDAFIASLQDENGQLREQLSAEIVGEDDPAEFAAVADEVTAEAAAIAEKRSKYEGRTSEGVASFASRITLPQE